MSIAAPADMGSEPQPSPGVWPDAAAPYEGAADHLIDVLHRVDLLLHRETLRYRRARPDGAPAGDDWLRFAAITDEEVDTLLRTGMAERRRAPAAAEATAIERSLAILSRIQSQRVAASAIAGIRLPLVDLVRTCELSEAETGVVALCLAPELDRRYERIYGYLHDDMTRRRPSVGLALDIASHSFAERLHAHALFAGDGRLLRHQIVHVLDDAGTGLQAFASRPFKLDERVLSFLVGGTGLDSQVRDEAAPVVLGGSAHDLGSRGERAVRDLLNAVEARRQPASAPDAPVFYLRAAAGAGDLTVVREFARRLTLPVIEVDGEELAARPAFHDGLVLVFREALLTKALLHLRHVDRLLEQDTGHTRLRLLGRCVDAARSPVVLSGEKHWTWPPLSAGRFPLPIQVERPGYAEQIEIWRGGLRDSLQLEEGDLTRLASLYPFSEAQVAAVLRLGRELAAMRGDPALCLTDVERSCREQCRPDFGQMARRVEVRAGWPDLVLPERQLQQLHDICVHARHRSMVYGRWGFDHKLSLGRGINVLFAGPSGTGKTMSAEVIAGDLGLDLYKVDLSQVISKYIGETEKNLHRIFQAAETGQAILFLDEADALLGKRSDVKDAHDRYANIEVAYLLQKMEEYEGVTILATNLRQNIDAAFTRRIRFIVEFPFPEEDYRLRIWRGIWPVQAPVAEDVDLASLAGQFRLCGGSIRNVAVAAAFQASEEEGEIRMRHLVHAAKRELQKIGRLVSEED